MKTDCTFCRIARRELETDLVFEDENTLAFLDANPLAKGHTIVIPKSHVSRVEDLEEDLAEAVFRTVHRLTGPIQEAVNAPASTIAINNGPASGQEIPHLHVHVIPRFRGDGGGPIHSIMKQKPRLGNQEMKNVAQSIRQLV
jgi:histidine triad (HIT) family protein